MLHGRKLLGQQAQTPVVINVARNIGLGNSVPFSVTWTAPSGSDLVGWSLRGEAKFAGGFTTALPDRSTIGPTESVSTSQDGVEATFSGATREGTVSIAARGCF